MANEPPHRTGPYVKPDLKPVARPAPTPTASGTPDPADLYAALDLGTNSCRMLIAVTTQGLAWVLRRRRWNLSALSFSVPAERSTARFLLPEMMKNYTIGKSFWLI